jgi:DnaJ-class molecular chaperone
MDDKRFVELLKKHQHMGIARDQYFAEKIPFVERCENCDGTGNQLYSMYQKCSECGGSGRK